MVIECYRAFLDVYGSGADARSLPKFVYARLLMEKFGGHFLSSKDTFVIHAEISALVKSISGCCRESQKIEEALSEEPRHRQSIVDAFRASASPPDDLVSSETTSDIDLDA